MGDKILTDIFNILKVDVDMFKSNLRHVLRHILVRTPILPLHIIRPAPNSPVVLITPQLTVGGTSNTMYDSISQLAVWVHKVSATLMDDSCMGMTHIVITKHDEDSYLVDIQVFSNDGLARHTTNVVYDLDGTISNLHVTRTVSVTHTTVSEGDV